MATYTQTITVPQTAEETYAALQAAVEKLRYYIAEADDATHTLHLTTRANAVTWGEKIRATVTADDVGSTVELFSEPKLKANVIDMGRGKRILDSIVAKLIIELNGGETGSLADELRQLAQLRDEGILTEEEFTAKKKLMLGI